MNHAHFIKSLEGLPIMLVPRSHILSPQSIRDAADLAGLRAGLPLRLATDHETLTMLARTYPPEDLKGIGFSMAYPLPRWVKQGKKFVAVNPYTDRNNYESLCTSHQDHVLMDGEVPVYIIRATRCIYSEFQAA